MQCLVYRRTDAPHSGAPLVILHCSERTRLQSDIFGVSADVVVRTYRKNCRQIPRLRSVYVWIVVVSLPVMAVKVVVGGSF